MAKNCCPVSLLFVVSKVFEKHVNDKLVDHLKKCGRLSDFQNNRVSHAGFVHKLKSYGISGQVFVQQLELASEVESDLWNAVDWGRKWLVDFNAGKT